MPRRDPRVHDGADDHIRHWSLDRDRTTRSRHARVHDRGLNAGSRITVPAVVVAEWWRGQRGPAARILDAVIVEPLSGALAKSAGETLALVSDATLVDAIVVASAARRGDLVLTPDPGDLSRIRDAAFPSVRIRAL
jgi:predicted nucleic acid-binding protein